MEFQRTKINQAVLTALASMVSAHAAAQDQAQADGRAIEEIVVTATKRAVPLQDVAVAVQALSEDALDLSLIHI